MPHSTSPQGSNFLDEYLNRIRGGPEADDSDSPVKGEWAYDYSPAFLSLVRSIIIHKLHTRVTLKQVQRSSHV